MTSTEHGDSRDHLSALPAELLYQIFDYLLPHHEPDRAFDPKSQTPAPFASNHPIQLLSHTCKTLRSEGNGWAKHWLKVHQDITHHKELKSENARTKKDQRGWLWGKGGLFKWMGKHCVFCGKTCARRAILVNGYMCCRECDRKEWPDKITRTQAQHHYDLKPHHLLPSKSDPDQLAAQAKSWPRIRYGTYTVSGMPTTMFLEHDVKRLAEAVHGDVEQHREMKLKAKQKRLEKKEKKKRIREKERALGLIMSTHAQIAQAQAWSTQAQSTEVQGTADSPIDLASEDEEEGTAGRPIDLESD